MCFENKFTNQLNNQEIKEAKELFLKQHMPVRSLAVNAFSGSFLMLICIGLQGALIGLRGPLYYIGVG
jgi:hypothetical protein